jgi:hypothetical protein
MNKIQLKYTPKQVELIQAMADKNPETAMKARHAFAAFVGPIIQQVLDLAPISPMLYKDFPYNEDDSPSFPLDMFYGTSVDHVTVWYQSVAGGLGSSLVTGLQEMKFTTYPIDSAVHLLERNIKRGRVPIVGMALNRMAQEAMAKQEKNAMLVVLRALGEASTNGNIHTITAATANVLQLDDFNNLITRSKRINVAFNGGTPTNPYSRGATDMLLSPEAMEEIRSWAYQPMNTRAVPNTDESTAVPLPESIRTQIFNAAGAPEIYGIRLHEALEFGVSQTYNTLFDQFDTGLNGPAGGAFSASVDELVLAWDATREALIRPVAINSETGGSVVVRVDDQWSTRSKKVGWFLELEEGRICLDSRVLTAIVF